MKSKKHQLMWKFDGNLVEFYSAGTFYGKTSALLVVKGKESTSFSGCIGNVRNEGPHFMVGYEDSLSRGWELILKMDDLKLYVNCSHNLPEDAPEILFVNASNAGAEIIAVVHGNGYGDVHRFRFPASVGYQWLGVLNFYCNYFGINLMDIFPKNQCEVKNNEK